MDLAIDLRHVNQLVAHEPESSPFQDITYDLKNFGFSTESAETFQAQDGAFLTPSHEFLPSSTPLEEVPAFIPRNRMCHEQPIIVVNGIDTTKEKVAEWAQLFADCSGSPIIPIYNLSEGSFFDVMQATSDRLNLADNPAAQSLANIIINAAMEGKPLHLACHSQGAMIVSRALLEATSRLSDKGVSKNDISQFMSTLTVETFGGAAAIYPPGPQYIHYVHEGDPVAWYLGVSKHGLSTNEQARIQRNIDAPEILKTPLGFLGGTDAPWANLVINPGENAKIVRIPNENHENWLDSHRADAYLMARREANDPQLNQHSAAPPCFVSQLLVSLYIAGGAAGIMGLVERGVNMLWNFFLG